MGPLKGRYLGLPVHRLIGGPLRSRVQAYATGFYRKRGGDAVPYLIEEAQQRADAGFSAIKLKLVLRHRRGQICSRLML